jgi:hypothetical protein
MTKRLAGQHVAHDEGEQRQREHESDPEPACHVDEFGFRAFNDAYRPRLERHAPQIRHDPGASRTICGCIGQVHSVRGPVATTGSRVSPHFGQFPGPRWWTSGCIGQV